MCITKTTNIEFHRNRHIQYFLQCLKGLPKQYASLDTNRMTLVHFCIQSLDMLGFLDMDEDMQLQYGFDKKHICNQIYTLQTVRLHTDGQTRIAGFKGSNFLGGVIQGDNCSSKNVGQYDQGHLAMTYTAICTLIALGDNLERLDKTSIINELHLLQEKDGSFSCLQFGSENDLRFLYCACAISYILDDWSGINKNLAVDYIKRCRSWDGAMGLVPNQEGHGGALFCGVASLVLMNRDKDILDERQVSSYNGISTTSTWSDEIVHWCVNRQQDGMQGRINKKTDTCYSYWVGGTLTLLQRRHLLNEAALTNFVLSCQTDVGGFSKFIDGPFFPDVLHSFYALAWLSISNELPYQIDCALGMSSRRLRSYNLGKRNKCAVSTS